MKQEHVPHPLIEINNRQTQEIRSYIVKKDRRPDIRTG